MADLEKEAAEAAKAGKHSDAADKYNEAANDHVTKGRAGEGGR